MRIIRLPGHPSDFVCRNLIWNLQERVVKDLSDGIFKKLKNKWHDMKEVDDRARGTYIAFQEIAVDVYFRDQHSEKVLQEYNNEAYLKEYWKNGSFFESIPGKMDVRRNWQEKSGNDCLTAGEGALGTDEVRHEPGTREVVENWFQGLTDPSTMLHSVYVNSGLSD
ncbi:zinc finger, RING/FYVE/PHD-type [Artemisia annua]|uniref:Zinc finger, RING/FYVE/PHD-type n=1 Tax=Artemisia annua TaxID=35608 RepID=A0A2U1KT31_ARTAN|nr:zinc finger, RING/FYVE/PHD-type [Artemisia annua]